MSPAAMNPTISTVQASGGGLQRWRWLLARRVSQLVILACFLAGPWLGIWLLKGNLSASLILDTVPLTDPWLTLQSWWRGIGLSRRP